MSSQSKRHLPTHPNSQLQHDWLYLHEQMPPEKWPLLPSFGSAASWLGMHQSLRKGQNQLDYLNRQYLQQQLDWQEYQNQLLQAAFLHYGHLHGHHLLEDHEDFPRLRQWQPKLARGFDLLESDHAQMDQSMQQIDSWLKQLKHTPAAKIDLVEQLQQAMQQNGQHLYRHLADEEDLVIPILALQAQ